MIFIGYQAADGALLNIGSLEEFGRLVEQEINKERITIFGISLPLLPFLFTKKQFARAAGRALQRAMEQYDSKTTEGVAIDLRQKGVRYDPFLKKLVRW